MTTNQENYRIVIADKLYIPLACVKNIGLFKKELTNIHPTEGAIKLFKYHAKKDLFIVNIGYYSKIKDLLKNHYLDDYRIDEKIKFNIEFLGKFREDQVPLMRQWYAKTADSGLIVARAGFGKTVIGSAIIADMKCPTIIIVPTMRILKQWQESINKFLNYNAGVIGGGIWDVQAVTVASYKSLLNTDKFNKYVKKRFSLVIIDEGHKAAAPEFLKLATAFYAKYKWGFTATPFRKDGMHFHLEGIFGKQCLESTAKGTKAIVRIVKTNNIFNFSNTSSYCDALNMLSIDKKFNSLVAKKISHDFNRKRKIVVLSPRIGHLVTLHNYLNVLGIPNGRLVSEKTLADKKHNSEILHKVNTEDFILLATDSLFGVGSDIPILDCLHLPYSMNNVGSFIQFVGRIERHHEGKPIPEFVDYFFVNKGFTAYQQKCRLDYYSQLGYEVVMDG